MRYHMVIRAGTCSCSTGWSITGCRKVLLLTNLLSAWRSSAKLGLSCQPKQGVSATRSLLSEPKVRIHICRACSPITRYTTFHTQCACYHLTPFPIRFIPIISDSGRNALQSKLIKRLHAYIQSCAPGFLHVCMRVYACLHACIPVG